MYDPLMKSILNNFNQASAKPVGAKPSAENSNEMLDILTRFKMIESAEPAQESLDKNQKKAGQLSATFKPKTVSVLTAKTDPPNPMAGKLVGGCEESSEDDRDVIDEGEVAEDLLSSVKKSLHDYLKSLDQVDKTDSDLKKKTVGDSDIKKKTRLNDLMVNMDEDPTQENPTQQPEPSPLINNTLSDNPAPSESAIKSVDCGEGRIFEIIGDEGRGFNIRHRGKIGPSRFGSFTEAETALELFAHRLKDSGDYRTEK